MDRKLWWHANRPSSYLTGVLDIRLIRDDALPRRALFLVELVLRRVYCLAWAVCNLHLYMYQRHHREKKVPNGAR